MQEWDMARLTQQGLERLHEDMARKKAAHMEATRKSRQGR